MALFSYQFVSTYFFNLLQSIPLALAAVSKTGHAGARPLYNGAVAAGERRVESG
jgi:hypothetical protein